MDRLTGTFDVIPGANGVIMADSIPAAIAANTSVRTLGATRVAPVPSKSSGTDGWTVYGWSITYNGVLVQTSSGSMPWAHFGDMWGGLLVDSPLADTALFGGDTAKGVLPSDIGTLSKIYDGDADRSFPTLDNAAGAFPGNVPVATRGQNVILPQPLHVGYGARLSMVLILLPSLMGSANGERPLIIVTPPTVWSITYEQGPEKG